MKALVAGAKGQLGRQVASLFMERGIDTVALGRKELDIGDLRAVNAAVDEHMPDVIVNCAAYNNVDGAEEDWQSAYLANGIGPKNLAAASKRTGAVLVHFSTDFVFNGEKSSPYNIGDMPDPVSGYGMSKLSGEEAVRENASRYFIIRTSWLFGDGEYSFPVKLLGWAKGKTSLRVVDDQRASPTYTADLALASIELMTTDMFGLYHITNSGDASRYEWARYILERTGWGGELQRAKSSEFPTPARRPAYSVLDNFPLNETIGHVLPDWRDATDRFLVAIGKELVGAPYTGEKMTEGNK